MNRGRQSWFQKLYPGEYEHFLIRRRADLAEPFAELALTPHPWPSKALDRLGRKIHQVMSLFVQLKARNAQPDMNLDHKQWPDLRLVLSYPNQPGWEDLPWDYGVSTVAATKAMEFDSHPEIGDQTKPNRFVLSLQLRREILPDELVEFLEAELRYQVQCGSPVLAKPRINSDNLPSNWEEIMWDLRVRLTDFTQRFVSVYRGSGFIDPFTVFFLRPCSVSQSDDHVSSGHFGYEYVIDGGQADHLAYFGVAFDPDQPLRLPYPNGVCSAVFLEARASVPHDLQAAMGSYRKGEVLPHVQKFERSALGGGLLIEVPAYSSGIDSRAADGPEIIVTFRIKLFDRKTSGEEAGPAPEEEASDDRVATHVASPDHRILHDGEGQVLTEICQRIISTYLRTRPSGLGHRIVFKSQEMLETREKYLRMARSDCHILICGESGTGKSYAAQEIARSSGRSTPFKRISAATISRDTTMSQLFGHVEGAYTDATKAKKGLLEVLDKGTLFLDDVDALDLLAQARLLSYLDTNEFFPFGGEDGEPLRSDVRFICATNVPIDQLLSEDTSGNVRLRRDFLYRIAEQYFEMPRLKDRTEDIETLVRVFIETQFERAGRRFQPTVDESFLRYAKSFPWNEGDLRQMEHAVLSAMIQTDSSVLTKRDLEMALASSQLWNAEV